MRIRLRQVVVAALDLTATETQIVDTLGVELCYRDPGVGVFGLRNALFPVGEQLLEVVSPIEGRTHAERLIGKRGGDTGYMVMLEVDDLAAARRRISDAGVRIVYEATDDGIVGLHLHPADIGGSILSIDQPSVWGEWPWAGPQWREHIRTDVVTDVLAVEVATPDPIATAARWSAVIGRPGDSEAVIRLDEGEIRFVAPDERGAGVNRFVFRSAPGAASLDTTIAGVHITSDTM